MQNSHASINSKICGLRTAEDIRYTNRSGADWAGFVFAKGSPREVTAKQARRIIQQNRLKYVGLFVDATVSDMQQIAQTVKLNAIQLHGQESPNIAKELAPYPIIKAFSADLNGFKLLEQWLKNPPENWIAALIDTPPHGPQPGQAGGSGKKLPWRIAMRHLKRLRKQYPHMPEVWLAGGLDANSIRDAQRNFPCTTIDASSLLESQKGLKSPQKMLAYGRQARRTRRL